MYMRRTRTKFLIENIYKGMSFQIIQNRHTQNVFILLHVKSFLTEKFFSVHLMMNHKKIFDTVSDKSIREKSL